jgi:hypothetical protein
MDLDTKTNQKHNHLRRNGLIIIIAYSDFIYHSPPPQQEQEEEENLKLENRTYFSICNKPIASTVLMAAYERGRILMYMWHTELFIRSLSLMLQP